MENRVQIELEKDITFLGEVLVTMEQELKGKVGPVLEGKLIKIEGFLGGYVETNPLDGAYWQIARVKDSLKRILGRRSFRGEMPDAEEMGRYYAENPE